MSNMEDDYKNKKEKFNRLVKLMSSPKRLWILEFLKQTPHSYTSIVEGFENHLDLGIGSSEVYKHLNLLRKMKLITKMPKAKAWVLTDKGESLLGIIKNLLAVV